MLKQSQDPYGYKHLLAYKRADELLNECCKLTGGFPKNKTLTALADQMDRSARSVKQNIVEGWKRNSTGEYYQFLGFAIASNAELLEDCRDICNGVYGEKGLKGVRGEKGEVEERGGVGIDIEKLRFYPIDPSLPPVVKLFLRAKEVNFLISNLQKSLSEKMTSEHRLSQADKLNLIKAKRREEDEWLKGMIEESKREKREKGD